MKAYKGFDNKMKCRGFQYEEGKTYETDTAELGKSGFHACEAPIDVLQYYLPCVDGEMNNYHQVELEDVSSERLSDDTKVCAKKITIGAKLNLFRLAELQVEYVKSKCEPSKSHNTKGDRKSARSTGYRSANSATGYGSANSATGYRSANSATGYGSANSATGYRSANSATGYGSANSATGDSSANSATGYSSANSATGYGSANSATGYGSANSATGYRSANSATGYGSANSATGYRSANSATGDSSANSATGYGSANISTGNSCKNEGNGEANICVAWGKNSTCKGIKGTHLVLSEWGDWDGEKYPFIGAVMVIVDGEKIKPDTAYMLKDGKVIGVKGE